MAEHPALTEGRVAVVTGAASGIGLAAARRFAWGCVFASRISAAMFSNKPRRKLPPSRSAAQPTC